MSAFVDLHLHSNHSDGSDPPAVVVQRAAALGFSAIALTDHDTIAGVAEAEAEAEAMGIEFLRGTEISAVFERREIHVVGLGIDIGEACLNKALHKLQEDRATRAERIIARLNEREIPIEYAAVQARAGHAAIGRLHIAQELYERGFVKTVQRAFDRHIGAGRPAFVPKASLPCDEAIARIHDAGGLAFLAHPGIGKNSLRMLTKLLALPFDGIEVHHIKHTPGQITGYAELARERGLLVSGGSDCHGTTKNSTPEMGKVRLPYEHYERICAALAKGR